MLVASGDRWRSLATMASLLASYPREERGFHFRMEKCIGVGIKKFEFRRTLPKIPPGLLIHLCAGGKIHPTTKRGHSPEADWGLVTRHVSRRLVNLRPSTHPKGSNRVTVHKGRTSNTRRKATIASANTWSASSRLETSCAICGCKVPSHLKSLHFLLQIQQ